MHQTKPAPLTLASRGEGVSVIRLSEIHGKSWRDTENKRGVKPAVDFALSEPFQLLTPESARRLKAAADAELGGAHEYSTKRTAACVRGARALEELVASIGPELEDLATELVGNGLRMRLLNPMDNAHLNVQRDVQSHPVDNWHQDSTPFVLVTILTDHTDDPGGHLIVRPSLLDSTHDATRNWKLSTPGQACFMQGSHIWHMAQQSEIGERFTLVTSFYCDDPLVYDMSSMHAALQYSSPVRAVDEFLHHALSRLSESAAMAPKMSLVSPRAALACNNIIGREVRKLFYEYRTGWDLIPAERKTFQVTEMWSKFRETVMALDDALTHSKSLVHVHRSVGDAARKMFDMLQPSHGKL